MSSRPQIGLIGCGSWGRFILRDLDALNCDVHVVARSKESRGRAHHGRAVSVVYKIEQLPRLDGIVVATPTITHGEIVEALLPRNVPMLVEKPLCLDPRQADSLVERVGDRLFVLDKWRYHPGVLALKELVRSETLGGVRGVGIRRHQKGCGDEDVDGVWVMLPNDLAIALEILGELPPPVSAHAVGNDGFLWSLSGVLGDGPFVSVDVCSRSPKHVREVRLFGTNGVAILEDGKAESLLILWEKKGAGNDPDEERRPFTGEMPLHASLRVFVEHLFGGKPPRTSAADGARVVRRVDELRRLAARRS